MHDKHLFEYAVIRVVPRVDREEFLNVGVILYCPQLKFLGLIYTLDATRLLSFSPVIDLTEIEEHLRAFDNITRANKEGGPIGRLEMPSRFRWLTATRSTILQTSRVHPGFCADPSAALARLHRSLVL